MQCLPPPLHRLRRCSVYHPFYWGNVGWLVRHFAVYLYLLSLNDILLQAFLFGSFMKGLLSCRQKSIIKTISGNDDHCWNWLSNNSICHGDDFELRFDSRLKRNPASSAAGCPWSSRRRTGAGGWWASGWWPPPSFWVPTWESFRSTFSRNTATSPKKLCITRWVNFIVVNMKKYVPLWDWIRTKVLEIKIVSWSN